MTNTAAKVRSTGVEQSKKLAEKYGEQWIIEKFLPKAREALTEDKKIGYNFRICSINSLAAMMPFMKHENINTHIIPMFVVALGDPIPNVRF